MVFRKASLLASLTIGATLAACAAAFAMQPAQTKAGYELGGEVGASVGNGTKIAGAADGDYGFHTGFLGQPYTDGFVDFLSSGRNLLGVNYRQYLVGVGIRQPLPIHGSVPVSVEGGLSYISGNVSVPGVSVSDNSTGGFIGGRVTLAQGGSVGINGMGRYHTEAGGFWQAGVGAFGPLGKGSGLYWQADYFHVGGLTVAGANAPTDSVLVGVRWSGMP